MQDVSVPHDWEKEKRNVAMELERLKHTKSLKNNNFRSTEMTRYY